ncbi:MAG: hypothetical protein WDN67_01860 [Candidatus Moraniibacteriota bacterium]
MKKFTFLPYAFLLGALFSWPGSVLAEMSTANFRITSDVIGSFGSKESSTSYELGDTGGEMGTSQSASTTYNLSDGFWSTVGDDGVIIFNITQPVVSLGAFNPSVVRYGTASFNVATTAQGGYTVSFSGDPLTFESNSINPLTSGGTSAPGTEQFGFNLVANGTPGIGVDPVGGAGQASSGYNTPNSFKFAPGDSIAQSAVHRARPTTPCRLSPTWLPIARQGNTSLVSRWVATGKY